MACQTSAGDVLTCVTAATAVYAVTAIPLMRLAEADHLVPRVVRELSVTAAVLLMLLSTPKGATR